MKAIYATPSSFSMINAGALRNLNVANALALEGHEVMIFTGDAPEDIIAPEWNSLKAPGVMIRAVGVSRAGRTARLRRAIKGIQIDSVQIGWADAVILYNPSPFQYFRIVFQRRKAGRIVLDVSEWLAPADLPGSWRSPYTWVYEGFMHLLPALLGRRGRALAISRPMAEWLRKRGADVLVVPPLSGVTAHRSDRAATVTRIVLSGSGIARNGKDAAGLRHIVRLAETAPEVLEGFAFDILGDVDDAMARKLEELRDRATFVQHGWVDWERSLTILGNASWLMLLRDPDIRRQRLGYPSKVIEALTLGVPVIVNRCGGTTDYLEDGSNALIIETVTEDDLQQALTRARSMCLYGSDLRFLPDAWAARLAEAVFG